jgi:hypothetical protein
MQARLLADIEAPWSYAASASSKRAVRRRFKCRALRPGHGEIVRQKRGFAARDAERQTDDQDQQRC